MNEQKYRLMRYVEIKHKTKQKNTHNIVNSWNCEFSKNAKPTSRRPENEASVFGSHIEIESQLLMLLLLLLRRLELPVIQAGRQSLDVPVAVRIDRRQVARCPAGVVAGSFVLGEICSTDTFEALFRRSDGRGVVRLTNSRRRRKKTGIIWWCRRRHRHCCLRRQCGRAVIGTADSRDLRPFLVLLLFWLIVRWSLVQLEKFLYGADQITAFAALNTVNAVGDSTKNTFNSQTDKALTHRWNRKAMANFMKVLFTLVSPAEGLLIKTSQNHLVQVLDLQKSIW
jgi:hypothetical protein